MAQGRKTRQKQQTDLINAKGSLLEIITELDLVMKEEFERLGRKLTTKELDELINIASNSPYLLPHINDARAKMASRDLCFRDALHQKLENYIQSVPEGDFDKFLGETSKSLEERLSDPETLAVLKALEERIAKEEKSLYVL